MKGDALIEQAKSIQILVFLSNLKLTNRQFVNRLRVVTMYKILQFFEDCKITSINLNIA